MGSGGPWVDPEPAWVQCLGVQSPVSPLLLDVWEELSTGGRASSQSGHRKFPFQSLAATGLLNPRTQPAISPQLNAKEEGQVLPFALSLAGSGLRLLWPLKVTSGALQQHRHGD